MIKTIDAVIFDMDGLLLDTEPMYQKIWGDTGQEFGIQVTAEIHRKMIGSSKTHCEQILRDHCGNHFSLTAFWEAWYRNLINRVSQNGLSLKSGAAELIAFLEQKNIPKAIATSTIVSIAHLCLEKVKIKPHFPVIVTGDQVKNGKPEPDIFLRAAQLLGVDPKKCLVLEDSPAGVKAAKKGNMAVFLIPDIIPPDEELKRLPDKMLSSLHDVRDYLASIL